MGDNAAMTPAERCHRTGSSERAKVLASSDQLMPSVTCDSEADRYASMTFSMDGSTCLLSTSATIPYDPEPVKAYPLGGKAGKEKTQRRDLALAPTTERVPTSACSKCSKRGPVCQPTP